jgi:predicted transcriptional regulator
MEFACKNFDIEEIIRCGLNLTKADFTILQFLMQNSKNKLDTNIISSKLSLELSTVQRSLKKMYQEKIVKRSQINIKSGGYSFVYCICDKKEIKDKIKGIINNWTEKFNLEINNW